MAWTGYEVATIVVTAMTPITVAGLGVFVARASQRLERVQRANEIVINRRVEIFGEVGPKLNQLLCFATFVGGWKEIKPKEVIGLKRDIDETMYSNRVLFSDGLFDAYRDFMATLFDMFATTGADARLRAPIDSRLGDRRELDWWGPDMEVLFSIDKTETIAEIQAAYDAMSECFRADLYVTHDRTLLIGS